MKGTTRFLFWFIVCLTSLALLIDFPNQLTISNKTVYGFSSFLKRFGVEKDFEFKKGLDLAGGSSITLSANMKDVAKSSRDDALESAKAVIERRVNFYGVSEPLVQTAKVNNDYRIVVELPGVTDVNSAVSLIGKTAQLTFWEDSSATPSAKIATDSALFPIGITSIFQNPKKTNLTGADLKSASVGFNQNTAEPEVQLEFTQEGAKKFEEITKRNVEKVVAIALDNEIIQAPRVNQVITGGNAVITGGFTQDQAKAVSIQLNAGALPVPLTILEQRTIGATLGEESLLKSFFAAVIGFITIVFFMCVLYGRLGVIASMSLVLYALFVLAIFKIIPVTLTLAGIAGFVLSIGMAVDANILIFERMKEEIRLGRNKDTALELGFSRAWSSIRDSNIASIITAIILMYFGTGIVRGFALTLFIGVLVSMFSAITVTRTFLRLIYK